MNAKKLQIRKARIVEVPTDGRCEALAAAGFDGIELTKWDMPAAEARKIVRNKTFPVRPMSVDDAMLQMELLGHSFFVFVNADTNRTNVLYLRADGDLGLMEPEV